jgi:uncharacterized protein (DUF169 family)
VKDADTIHSISSLLGLDTPPVGLAFVHEPPAGVQVAKRAVPSACAFWREAERGVFYASAERHFNCAVGAMVMGFRLPPAVAEQLGGLVEAMCACNYLTPEEAGQIPAVDRPSAGILYGPFAELPKEPDLMLLWLTPAQAMLYSEAAGMADWTHMPTRTTGRPACAALPLAMQNQAPTLSLGCMGMRTFTEVGEDRLLAAVPSPKVGDLADALARTVAANEQMQSFYQGHKAQFVDAPT